MQGRSSDHAVRRSCSRSAWRSPGAPPGATRPARSDQTPVSRPRLAGPPAAEARSTHGERLPATRPSAVWTASGPSAPSSARLIVSHVSEPCWSRAANRSTASAETRPASRRRGRGRRTTRADLRAGASAPPVGAQPASLRGPALASDQRLLLPDRHDPGFVVFYELADVISTTTATRCQGRPDFGSVTTWTEMGGGVWDATVPIHPTRRTSPMCARSPAHQRDRADQGSPCQFVRAPALQSSTIRGGRSGHRTPTLRRDSAYTDCLIAEG